MNVDTLNSKYKVVSKYFAGKTAMDESLTDFKEKKSFKVPKNNKATAAKPKARKVKRVKGQKDIRTALKQKKNELVAYSEDFDNVCKKSGIDVDSEQLQLAIALSKSLQTSESIDSPTNSTKCLTTQQRTGLIRTTLKEYGFKVPEKPNACKKTKKRRKPYKLLLTSDDEKQQIIADKYSQLLFELNNLQPTTSEEEDLVIPNLFVYNMSTNIEYENIKEDSIFYVDSLVEETPNTVGCLLKNWADIPGRPVSPEVDKSELLFSQVECSQEELDIVLSGPLKCSKDILQKKSLYKDKTLFTCHTVDKIERIQSDPVLITENISPELLEAYDGGTDSINNSLKPESQTVENEIEQIKLHAVTQTSRSLSPDLFDDGDEIDDTVVETPNDNIPKFQNKLIDNVTKDVSEIMDLTECVNNFSQKNKLINKDVKLVSQLSQVDEIRRKSNDFMEITECVGGSQAVLERIDEEIDLTEHSGNSTKTEVNAQNIETDGDSSQRILKKTDECIDLTPYCIKDIEKEETTNSNMKITESVATLLPDKANQPIYLTELCVRNSDSSANVNTEEINHMDLTQSSNSSTDSLPFVQISGKQKQTVPDTSLDETIIMNENDYLETNTSVVDKEYQNNQLDTRSPKANIEINNAGNASNQYIETKRDVEDAIDVSPSLIMSPETDEIPIIDLEETHETVELMHGDIDLTQSSNSNEASESILNNTGPHVNNSGLGKKDDVSVDYDEALENMNSFPYYINDENDDDNTDQNHSQETNEKVVLSSSKQAVLEVPDNELTSPSKAINAVEDNNFDFGGISIIDNLPSFNRRSRSTMNSIPNGSMSDSLPLVNIRGKALVETSEIAFKKHLDPILSPKDHQKFPNEIAINTGPQTPQEKVLRHIDAETPEQSEYIVKTDNVTPMLNYASMSTPERNKELDKYGLKPFKRKRAIQLLTHLYNQTHPYVESTDEVTSPKKRKKENQSQPSSSKSSSGSISPRNKSQSPRMISPRKASKSPRKNSTSPKKQTENYGDSNESDKENELFTVTCEVPAIRHIECDADDWVFQKREKAKLHSCRVPLHISFHNYVTCRRRLHEAILRYEPVNIDVIHKELAASGHRYDPKDLLKFMDKKCITVKTADNTKNNKRY